MSAALALPAVASSVPQTKPSPGMGAPNESDKGDDGFAGELQRARAPGKPQPTKPVQPLPAGKVEAQAVSMADAEPAESAETETAVMADVEHVDDEDQAPTLAGLLPGWPGPSTAIPRGALTLMPSAANQADGADADPLGLKGIAGRDAIELSRGARVQDQAADPAIGAAPGALSARGAAAPAGAEPRQAASGHEAVAAAAPAKSVVENPLPSALPLPAVPALAAASHLGAATASVHESRIAVPLDSAAFAPALATQVTWLVQEGVQQARLSLNPAEMGPLAVRIVLDGTQARIDFSADVAGTRNAIEASLPALAAALHDSGLTLSGGGVSDGRARDGAHAHRHDLLPSAGRAAAVGDGGSGPDAGLALPERTTRGLVDLVA